MVLFMCRRFLIQVVVMNCGGVVVVVVVVMNLKWARAYVLVRGLLNERQ